jgi:hypothetical protein
MKKVLIIILLLFCVSVQAQRKVGSLASIFSTSGWDVPNSYTPYYTLPYYTLLSNPGGWINISQRMIDSLFNKLIVKIDSLQFKIQNDSLRYSTYSSGQNAFDTTAETDTISITGLDSSDIFIVTIREAVPGANDLLGVKLISSKAIIQRPASGTSGLKYNWIWRRVY